MDTRETDPDRLTDFSRSGMTEIEGNFQSEGNPLINGQLEALPNRHTLSHLLIFENFAHLMLIAIPSFYFSHYV